MANTIIIGDIHGCYDELLDLLDQIGAVGDDLLISVGDIIDRGPKSMEVFDFFQSRKNSIVVMGNHERKHVNGILGSAQQQSLHQFGKYYSRARDIMITFPYYYEDDDVIVVHAALNPGVVMVDQREEILCGTMGGQRLLKKLFGGKAWFEFYNGAKPVVFGHKVVGKSAFVFQDKIFGIDTGACHGGWLTALLIPEFRLYSIKARCNYWSRARQVRGLRD